MDDYTTTGASVLDVDDLFRLDPRVSPADGLTGAADSAECTTDGCTASCVACQGDDDDLSRRAR